jgi:hypothetical protein
MSEPIIIHKKSKFPNILSWLIASPLVWLMIVPVVISDIFLEIYHQIAFPIFGIKKVNRSQYIRIYDIPQEGDIITFTKNKTFNSFSRPITKTSITSSAVYIKIKVFIQKGDKYKVRRVIRGIDDVALEIVSITDESDDCAISFIETKNYWKTKSDLRNNKIEQILN